MIQPDKLCRACATIVEENCQEDAFKDFQKFRDLYSMLTELKVYDDDDLPKLLCPTCVGLLETIENFKEACARSVDSIRKLVIANLKEEPIEEVVSAEMLEPIMKFEITDIESDDGPIEQKANVVPMPKSMKFKKTSKNVRPMCALCDKTFVNMKGIRKHMLLELKRIRENKIKVEVKSKPVKEVAQESHCPHEGCGRIFINRKNLRKHLKMHEDVETTTWCSTCNKKFMSVGHYRRHVKIFHKSPRTLNLTCSICKEVFRTATKLRAHIYKQHPEETKMYACKTCGACFALEKELETHKITAHPSLRFYICHHCGKVRSSKYAILNHLVNNHSDPVYDTCPVCRAKVVKSKMLAHCRHKHSVRTDIKIIKCKFCNKQFKQNCVLRRHLRSHTGERPFVCHVCGMAFIRSGSLKKHFYTHSGERPIHCDLCGKGLYSSHALKIHMNIHKREWIAQGQTGIELMVYATSNKSKNSTEKKYANLKQPRT